jgi:PTH1 family peptidyl-tRNA hydrolase
MWLVVGLGNPGTQYRGTRHNVGFLILDELLARRQLAARTKMGADIVEGQVEGERVVFCKPMEFMNVSGNSVARIAQFWKIPPERTVVAHDDLDLAFGRMKLAVGGGAGGHNGVRSIISGSGSADFFRVRVGINRPPPGHDSAGYVLTAFTPAEREELPVIVARAADAVETVIAQGAAVAMNRFNASKKQREDD